MALFRDTPRHPIGSPGITRYNIRVLFYGSADKWGVARSNAEHAAVDPVRIVVLSDLDPHKELRIGFGLDGAPLEVVLVDDPDGSGEMVLIHAMPLRKSYMRLLPGQRRGRKS